MIWASSLNDDITTQSIGYTTMIAHTARNKWENPPKATSPARLSPAGLLSGLRVGRTGSGPTGVVGV
jgi:hypothetical protein